VKQVCRKKFRTSGVKKACKLHQCKYDGKGTTSTPLPAYVFQFRSGCYNGAPASGFTDTVPARRRLNQKCAPYVTLYTTSSRAPL